MSKNLNKDELKAVTGGNGDPTFPTYQRPVRKDGIYKCLKCSYYSIEYDEVLNHVKNVHNGDSSMIGIYDLS